MISPPFLVLFINSLCILAASTNSEQLPTRRFYQISERKIHKDSRFYRRAEESLTFSGDVEKIIEIANGRGADREDYGVDDGNVVAVVSNEGGEQSDGNDPATDSDPFVVGTTETLNAGTKSPSMSHNPGQGTDCPSAPVASPSSSPVSVPVVATTTVATETITVPQATKAPVQIPMDLIVTLPPVAYPPTSSAGYPQTTGTSEGSTPKTTTPGQTTSAASSAPSTVASLVDELLSSPTAKEPTSKAPSNPGPTSTPQSKMPTTVEVPTVVPEFIELTAPTTVADALPVVSDEVTTPAPSKDRVESESFPGDTPSRGSETEPMAPSSTPDTGAESVASPSEEPPSVPESEQSPSNTVADDSSLIGSESGIPPSVAPASGGENTPTASAGVPAPAFANQPNLTPTDLLVVLPTSPIVALPTSPAVAFPSPSMAPMASTPVPVPTFAQSPSESPPMADSDAQIPANMQTKPVAAPFSAVKPTTESLSEDVALVPTTHASEPSPGGNTEPTPGANENPASANQVTGTEPTATSGQPSPITSPLSFPTASLPTNDNGQPTRNGGPTVTMPSASSPVTGNTPATNDDAPATGTSPVVSSPTTEITAAPSGLREEEAMPTKASPTLSPVNTPTLQSELLETTSASPALSPTVNSEVEGSGELPSASVATTSIPVLAPTLHTELSDNAGPTQLTASPALPPAYNQVEGGEPTPFSPSVSESPAASPVPAPTMHTLIGTETDQSLQPPSPGQLPGDLPMPTADPNSAIILETDTDSSPIAAPARSPTVGGDATVASPAATPSSITPVVPTDTLIACDDSDLGQGETIDFTYSLETSSNDSSLLENIRKSSELALSKDIANLLLPCDVRRLSENALGFEGIDHVPEDSVSGTDCDATIDIKNDCTVFDGILTVYISPEADFELAKYYTLTAIREALGLLDGQVTGLVKATYLGPDIVNPSAFGTSEIIQDDIATGPDNLNTSLVLFAVGGCAFAASVGLIYYLRRHGNHTSSGAATHAAGSDQHTNSRLDADRPLSPFSEMLPSAYRFDQDGNMSAILELDDESATQRSGIVVSDSGFTTEEEGSIAISIDGTASLNRRDSPVLGARKRHDESMDSLLEML